MEDAAAALSNALAGRADHKIEQLVRGLSRISLERDRAEGHKRTFVDLEPQPIATLDLIMNARFGVAVLAIKNFDEKRQIVRAGRSQAVTVDRGELFFHRRTQIFFFECLLTAQFNSGCGPRDFLLLFGNDVLLLLFFLGPGSVDRSLRRQLERSCQVA